MTTLDELLSLTKISTDMDAVAGPPCDHADDTFDICHECIIERQVVHRLALVRQTLQEAAKLVCHKCASSQYEPAECVDGVWRHVNLGHTEYGQYTTTVPCDAFPIHARLAKEKP